VPPTVIRSIRTISLRESGGKTELTLRQAFLHRRCVCDCFVSG
jgi:hypothetical protein